MTSSSPRTPAERWPISCSSARSAARARVAVLPCCHNLATNHGGSLAGWVDGPLAIDVMRAVRLEQHGYRVRTYTISAEITPKTGCSSASPHLIVDNPRPCANVRAATILHA